jgi:hypothetical protein
LYEGGKLVNSDWQDERKKKERIFGVIEKGDGEFC